MDTACYTIANSETSEELAEFLRQAREVDFSLSEARSRFVAIDEYRIDAVNPALNAPVAATDPQRCLDAADEAENVFGGWRPSTVA